MAARLAARRPLGVVMSTRDIVLTAAFWHDRYVQALSSDEKLYLLYIYSHTDKYGIARLDTGIKVDDKLLESLSMAGHLVVYEDDHMRLAWVARYGEQPTRGKLAAASYNLPAPPKVLVERCLTNLYARRPTKVEMKRACPAAFGMRKQTAVTNVKADVESVFQAWSKFQKSPSRCRLGSGSKRVIESALKEADAQTLVEFIEYAYRSDDAGPRYWRGHNQQQRTYLGLDNLLRVSRLAGRIEAMHNWQGSRGKASSTDNGTTLGPMAAYRRRVQNND